MKKALVVSLVAVCCLAAAFFVAKTFFASNIVEKIITTALNNSDNIESWNSESIAFDDKTDTLVIDGLKIKSKNGMDFDITRLEASGIDVLGKTVAEITVDNSIVNMQEYNASCNVGNIHVSGIDGSNVEDAKKFISTVMTNPYVVSDSYVSIQNYGVDGIFCNIDTVNIEIDHLEIVEPQYIGKLAERSTAVANGINFNMGGLIGASIPEMTATTDYDETNKTLRLKYNTFEVVNYLTMELEYVFADFDPAKLSESFESNAYDMMDAFSVAKIDIVIVDKGVMDTIYQFVGMQLGMNKEQISRYLIDDFNKSGGVTGLENSAKLNSAIQTFLRDPKSIRFFMEPFEPVPYESISTMIDEGDVDSLKKLNMSVSVNGMGLVEIY